MGKVKQGIGIEDVNAHLLALARRELELQDVQVRMNQDLDGVKAGYAADIAHLARQIRAGKKLLEREVTEARRTLFERGVKSLALLFGWVGFREQKGSVKMVRGTTEDEAVRLLQKRGKEHLVRTRLEINRAAVQAALSNGELDEKGLHACGLQVKRPGEKFFCEPKWEDIKAYEG